MVHCPWVTTCYMEGKVVVYDSLPMKSLPEEVNKQLRDLYGKDGQYTGSTEAVEPN